MPGREGLGRREARSGAVDEGLPACRVVADQRLLPVADPELQAELGRGGRGGVEHRHDLERLAGQRRGQHAVAQRDVVGGEMLATQFLQLLGRGLDDADLTIDLAQAVVPRQGHRAAELSGRDPGGIVPVVHPAGQHRPRPVGQVVPRDRRVMVRAIVEPFG